MDYQDIKCILEDCDSYKHLIQVFFFIIQELFVSQTSQNVQKLQTQKFELLHINTTLTLVFLQWFSLFYFRK